MQGNGTGKHSGVPEWMMDACVKHQQRLTCHSSGVKAATGNAAVDCLLVVASCSVSCEQLGSPVRLSDNRAWRATVLQKLEDSDDGRTALWSPLPVLVHARGLRPGGGLGQGGESPKSKRRIQVSVKHDRRQTCGLPKSPAAPQTGATITIELVYGTQRCFVLVWL